MPRSEQLYLRIGKKIALAGRARCFTIADGRILVAGEGAGVAPEVVEEGGVGGAFGPACGGVAGELPVEVARAEAGGDGLRFAKFGSAVRYAVADIEDFERRCLRTSTSDDGEDI